MNEPPEAGLNDLQTTESASGKDLPPVVVIAGPTAVGKTRLAIELAIRFGGEVVNADSRYLYRGFVIGVAKPDGGEQRGVPHHLIDILDPGEEMSLALYQKRANEAIRTIHRRNRLPLLTGGTPLYLNAVIEGWRIPEVPPDPEFRRHMEEIVDRQGLDSLVTQLAAVDPVAAERAATNPRRVIRALEIHRAAGQPMSQLEGKTPPPWHLLQLGLTMPRDALFRAIDARVDDQIARGLANEVRGLLDAGVDPNASAFSSIGYRQMLPYLAGEATLDSVIERIKYDTHRYVRHQETWLRRSSDLIRIDVTEPDWVDRATDIVQNFLERGNSNC
ncbi:MAG: tRNA (adenosine(37)-N6)-dimethylallyltransferase MiaA [Thermomicrobiales bacterium]|nr:tRNA (adenosine(37)-N6)-dimethylallyltransferase MiaA [Thermomicrobiales bacterium]